MIHMGQLRPMGLSAWILAITAAILGLGGAQKPCAAQDAAPQQPHRAAVLLADVPVAVLTEAFGLTTEQKNRIISIHDWFVDDRKSALAALPVATSPQFHEALQSFLQKQQELAEQTSRDIEARLTDPQKKHEPDILGTMTDIASVGIPLNVLANLNLSSAQIGKMVDIAAEMNGKLDAVTPQDAAQTRTIRKRANERALAELTAPQKKILSDETLKLLSDPKEQAVADAMLDRLITRSVALAGNGGAQPMPPSDGQFHAAAPSDGGKGAAQPEPNAGVPAVTLSASKTSIKNGESVTLTWMASGASQIVSSNFGAASLPGAINVTPAATTTYTLTVGGAAGPNATQSVTVEVSGGAPRFLLLGKKENADVTKIQALLQTMGPVNVQDAMPNDGAAFDAVVIHDSANITPDDARKVQTILGQGKGVVLVQRAPRLLATGDIKKSDVSAIASWFGGVTSLEGPGAKAAWKVRPGAGTVTVPNGLFGQQVSASGATFAKSVGDNVDVVDGAAIKPLGIASWMDIGAFGFKPQSGGRVYFQGSSNGTTVSSGTLLGRLFGNNTAPPASDNGATAALFQAGAYWAATGQ